VQLQLTPVPLDQLGEGIPVAGLRPGDQISVDENPPIGSRSQFHLLGYWYRRRANQKPGTPCPLFQPPGIYLFDRRHQASQEK
jgi:hypothetical protein